MSERPPFPEVIDNSFMDAFRSCPQKLFMEYLEHWKPRNPSIHLHAGGAFAHGIEAARRAYFEQGLLSGEAVERGAAALLEFYSREDISHDTAKTLDRMLGALDYYFDQYPLGSDPLTPYEFADGRRGIEFSFAVPLAFNHPVTGLPLIYAGRADMLGKMNGMNLIVDEKTTTSLGAQWQNQWDLRPQFTGYVWAGRESGIPVDGVVVRGISILKTKYETQQVITYRPEWQIERWYAQLLRDLSRIEQMWSEGVWDYNISESCNSYGGCLFKRVCLSPEPGPWLTMHYQRRRWDPVTRTETVVGEPA